MAKAFYSVKRYERKFFLTEEQYERLLPLLREHMQPDSHGRGTVSSLYFDTDDYAIIRWCLDHPSYKEKFRIRSYGVSANEEIVYAEIKKKYHGVTYKRRVELPLDRLPAWRSGHYVPDGGERITEELLWFLNRYQPDPKVLLCCDREAWKGVTEEELRITFDRDIRWRSDHLRFAEGNFGAPLLTSDRILMEVKTPTAIPLWLARFLSEEHLFSTGFSKYGTCYRKHIMIQGSNPNKHNSNKQSEIIGKEWYHADQSL